MIAVKRATAEDHQPIVAIGKVAVAEAHRDSTSAENLDEYLEKNYNEHTIREELSHQENYTVKAWNCRPHNADVMPPASLFLLRGRGCLMRC